MGAILLLSLIPIALIGLLVGGDDDPVSAAIDEDDSADVRLGGPNNDQISGDGSDELIFGFNGNDLLAGNGGDDLLVGDNGDDTLTGGAGSDILLGAAGNDQLDGGPQDDFLVGGAGDDVLAGGAGDDVLVGMGGDNRMDGGAGNDILIGLTPDRLRPGATLDDLDSDEFLTEVQQKFGTLSAALQNRLLANALSFEGGLSADRMLGGAGNDTLVGDRGDVMIGGEGADQFGALAPTVALDPSDPAFGQVVRIEDYVPGTDRIEVLFEGSGAANVTVAAQGSGVVVRVNGLDVAFVAGVGADQLAASDVRVTRL